MVIPSWGWRALRLRWRPWRFAIVRKGARHWIWGVRWDGPASSWRAISLRSRGSIFLPALSMWHWRWPAQIGSAIWWRMRGSSAPIRRPGSRALPSALNRLVGCTSLRGMPVTLTPNIAGMIWCWPPICWTGSESHAVSSRPSPHASSLAAYCCWPRPIPGWRSLRPRPTGWVGCGKMVRR